MASYNDNNAPPFGGPAARFAARIAAQLADEAERYLRTVDAFRAEGCDPHPRDQLRPEYEPRCQTCGGVTAWPVEKCGRCREVIPWP